MVVSEKAEAHTTNSSYVEITRLLVKPVKMVDLLWLERDDIEQFSHDEERQTLGPI